MRTLLLLGWLLACSVTMTAQDVTEDTVTANGHEPETQPVSLQWERNGSSIPADTIGAMKEVKELGYLQHFDSVLKAVKSEQVALNNRPLAREEPSWLERFFAAKATMYFFWVLAFFFIGFILYRLFIAGLFRRNPRLGSLPAEDLPEGMETEQDWQRLAQSAATAGEYRMATRYLYLHTLQQLNERGRIRLTADKTNARYLTELADTPYRDPAAALFRYYEYSWYGGFTTDALIFNKVKSLMQQILQEK